MRTDTQWHLCDLRWPATGGALPNGIKLIVLRGPRGGSEWAGILLRTLPMTASPNEQLTTRAAYDFEHLLLKIP